MDKKWMRLTGLAGCMILMVSCKQTPATQMRADYATMKVATTDKEFNTSYSATIR